MAKEPGEGSWSPGQLLLLFLFVVLFSLLLFLRVFPMIVIIFIPVFVGLKEEDSAGRRG